jgi:hypothetical protein
MEWTAVLSAFSLHIVCLCLCCLPTSFICYISSETQASPLWSHWAVLRHLLCSVALGHAAVIALLCATVDVHSQFLHPDSVAQGQG